VTSVNETHFVINALPQVTSLSSSSVFAELYYSTYKAPAYPSLAHNIFNFLAASLLLFTRTCSDLVFLDEDYQARSWCNIEMLEGKYSDVQLDLLTFHNSRRLLAMLMIEFVSLPLH